MHYKLTKLYFRVSTRELARSKLLRLQMCLQRRRKFIDCSSFFFENIATRRASALQSRPILKPRKLHFHEWIRRAGRLSNSKRE